MKKRQMPFALYNALLCLLVAAVFVLSILCIQAAEEKWYLKLDLSGDQVTKLSDYTFSRLDALAADRAWVDEDMANTLIWLFRDYLLGRRCAQCGCVFTDEKQEDRCPACGASAPDWNL